jgi:hypothetical protein
MKNIFVIILFLLTISCANSYPVRPAVILSRPPSFTQVSPEPPITVFVRTGSERWYVLEDFSMPGPNTRNFIDMHDMNRQGGILIKNLIQMGGGVIEERTFLQEVFTTPARWIRYSVAAIGKNGRMYVIHFTVDTSTGYRRNYSISGIYGETFETALGNAIVKSVETIIADPNIKQFLKGKGR